MWMSTAGPRIVPMMRGLVNEHAGVGVEEATPFGRA